MNLALMKNVVALSLDDMIPFQAAFGFRPDSELAEMMNLFLLTHPNTLPRISH